MIKPFSFSKDQIEELNMNAPDVPPSAISEIEKAITTYRLHGTNKFLNKEAVLKRLDNTTTRAENFLRALDEVIPAMNEVMQVAMVNALEKGDPRSPQIPEGVQMAINELRLMVPDFVKGCNMAKKIVGHKDNLFRRNEYFRSIRIRLASDIHEILESHGAHCSSSPQNTFIEVLQICLDAVGESLEPQGRQLQEIARMAIQYIKTLNRWKQNYPYLTNFINRI